MLDEQMDYNYLFFQLYQGTFDYLLTRLTPTALFIQAWVGGLLSHVR